MVSAVCHWINVCDLQIHWVLDTVGTQQEQGVLVWGGSGNIDCFRVKNLGRALEAIDVTRRFVEQMFLVWRPVGTYTLRHICISNQLVWMDNLGIPQGETEPASMKHAATPTSRIDSCLPWLHRVAIAHAAFQQLLRASLVAVMKIRHSVRREWLKARPIPKQLRVQGLGEVSQMQNDYSLTYWDPDMRLLMFLASHRIQEPCLNMIKQLDSTKQQSALHATSGGSWMLNNKLALVCFTPFVLMSGLGVMTRPLHFSAPTCICFSLMHNPWVCDVICFFCYIWLWPTHHGLLHNRFIRYDHIDKQCLVQHDCSSSDVAQMWFCSIQCFIWSYLKCVTLWW